MQEWKSFVDKIARTIESNPDLDEANTKSMIISPLLKKLGWNQLEGEVRAEYPIKFATRTSHVDYALLVEGSPAVFVEAKALRSDINSDHARQLIDYGRHKGVNWCVLTNGKELRIYNSEWMDPEADSPQDALVEAIEVDEFIDKLDLLQKISRESIESGDTSQALKRIKQAKDTIESLKNNRGAVVSALKGILNDHAGGLVQDKIDQATTRFVSELIDELSEYPGTTTPKPKSKPRENGGKELQPDKIDLPTKRRAEIKEECLEGTVMVTPSSPELIDEETGLPSGVGFFKKYNAWGFVRVGSERNIKYLALCVTSPESQVKYFGKVTDIVDPKGPKSPVKRYVNEKEDLASWNLEKGKKVVVLEDNSLVELEDPIKGTTPLQSFWYTSLERFVEAEGTDDLKG